MTSSLLLVEENHLLTPNHFQLSQMPRVESYSSLSDVQNRFPGTFEFGYFDFGHFFEFCDIAAKSFDFCNIATKSFDFCNIAAKPFDFCNIATKSFNL